MMNRIFVSTVLAFGIGHLATPTAAAAADQAAAAADQVPVAPDRSLAPQPARGSGPMTGVGPGIGGGIPGGIGGRIPGGIRIGTGIGTGIGSGRGWTATNDDRADDLYDEGRQAIEEGRYERAIDRFDRLIALKTNRTDAALYWKAYSLSKTGNRDAALQVLSDLQKQFADSRWFKDAKALEVEVRQASGQKVSPESETDDELKLMALRGLMNSDPDQALPVIEKMLAGANSVKVKDRALFVISQSHSARARDLIVGVAKGNSNPDLQLKAIRYLGIMGGTENRQILAEVYKSSADPAVKRSILRSFMTANDRERLFGLAKGETDAALRGEAIQQLGVMHATSELSQLYQSESSLDIKKRIIQGMFVSGEADKIIELARSEKDPELRKTAIHYLGMMKRAGTTEALTSIYSADAAPEIRKTVINALFVQNNATALVSLARNEKNVEMKKEIVSKLSIMKSKEATDYLLELLK